MGIGLLELKLAYQVFLAITYRDGSAAKLPHNCVLPSAPLPIRCVWPQP